MVWYLAMPAVQKEFNLKKGISLTTARRWMKTIKYPWKKGPNGAISTSITKYSTLALFHNSSYCFASQSFVASYERYWHLCMSTIRLKRARRAHDPHQSPGLLSRTRSRYRRYAGHATILGFILAGGFRAITRPCTGAADTKGMAVATV
jgi:hypothetical protein